MAAQTSIRCSQVYTVVSVEEFVYFQIKHYTERLREERGKPDSDAKTKAIAFLRSQLYGISLAASNLN